MRVLTICQPVCRHSASKPPPKRRGRPPKVRPPPEPEVPPPSEDQDAVPEQAAEGEFSAAAGQDVPEADAEAAAAAPSQAEVPVTVPIAAKGPRGGGRPKDIPSGGDSTAVFTACCAESIWWYSGLLRTRVMWGLGLCQATSVVRA